MTLTPLRQGVRGGAGRASGSRQQRSFPTAAAIYLCLGPYGRSDTNGITLTVGQRAKPSLLAVRAALFDWVLVRAGRLVSEYLQRGQWGLSPVIQLKVGSLRWTCGSVWSRTWTAIPADTLFPEDVVLLQAMISHRPLRDSLSVTTGPLPSASW
ncbi:hypothetical protein NQZ68_023188 [Dissostichus eleginoides]|nr:hypothetical protein NQZ68_023188 [Dissostichus eleginoides]